MNEIPETHHPKCECPTCRPGLSLKIETHFQDMTINEVADMVHDNAKQKGFHDLNEPIDVFVSNQCNNMHGEVTELWDAYRAGKENYPCDKADKMVKLGLRQLTCQEEEVADIVIRALDFSRRIGIDIWEAIKIKHAYNQTREYKHGKKN